MKNIRIQRITLENFKCHAHFALELGGRSASIYGDNATGKTSVYDALTWLLFGKDSEGNGEKNVELKPLGENGEVKDHLAETSVETVLLVDGVEVVLRRTYKEVWTHKRGRAEATFDGNTSEYYVDGVPVKKFGFQEKVCELVDEDTFRMLTSVTYFSEGLAWQDRRAELFRVSGVMDDAEILRTNEAFLPLIDGMGRLSLEDYKKKLLAEKRSLNGARTEIPARISECQRTLEDVERLDFDAARRSLEELNVRREGLEARLLSIEQDAEREKKAVEIREARAELSALEGENRVYRSRRDIGAGELQRLRSEHIELLSRKKEGEREIAFLEQNVKELDRAIAASRERWIEVHSTSFSGGICPTCRQVLPADQVKAASDHFESQKKERLREIEQSASTLKESRASAEGRIASEKQKLSEIENRIAEVESRVTLLAGQAVSVEDMPEYAEKYKAIEDRLHALERELSDLSENTEAAKSSLIRELQAVKIELEAQRGILGKEAVLDYTRKRIETLREEAGKAAEVLDRIEGTLYLIDEYTRYKTRYVEDRVNGLFRIARFRLFREQANGGVEERCDVVCDGVPYGSLNSGMRINVGVDVINTLSRAYGVTVPLFIDNAESVTRLEAYDGQTVRLVVSESDKELRICYED